MTPRPVAFTSLRLHGVLVLSVLMVLSVTALAPSTSALVPTRESGPGIDPAPTPRSESRAVELLRKVADADRSVAYLGVQFVSAWSPTGTASALVEVQNIPGHGTALRVRGSGSGPASSIFTTASGEGIELPIGGGPVELLVDNYSLRYAGNAKVAGRRAEVVEMRGDEDVLAARFWVDRRTGLPLRRELYDESGRTVRASAFVQIQVGERAAPSHLPPVAPSAIAHTLGSAEVDALQDDGWQCPTTMAGHLSLYETRRVETASGPVLHLSYSDGLSTVSVFQQSGRLPADGLAGYDRVESAHGVRYVRSGIPEQVVWSADGVVYTVVADAPPETVEQVVADLPHTQPPQDGMLDRLGRGLVRVGSWVNPFA